MSIEIINFNEAPFTSAFGVYCSKYTRSESRQGLYATLCKIPPLQASLEHRHFEEEVFFIHKGHGQLTINFDSQLVKAGDLITIPSQSSHHLINLDEKDFLEFTSIYSEDFSVAKIPSQLTITVAPPTPNGPLHLGHISGPYLAADILNRYHLLRTCRSCLIGGTDDHQNYVEAKAQSLQMSPEIFRSEMRQRILEGFHRLNIQFTDFQEPMLDINYQKRVCALFELARQLNIIELQEVDFPFCNHCNIFLLDAHILGLCPNCKEPSHGACENCGLVALPFELEKPECSHCNNGVSHRKTEVYLFDLSNHLPLIREDLAHLKVPARLAKLIDENFQKHHLKVLITHPEVKQYGIRAPENNQSFHVWFEMAVNYQELSQQSISWVHCFGFDNAFYYLLFIPALLRAIHPKAKLPDAVITNEFLLLEGSKFSTSRQHAIWADEFEVPTDILRAYLCSIRPSEQQSNFSIENWKQFAAELQTKLLKLNLMAKQISNLRGFSKSNNLTRELIQSQKAVLRCNRLTRDLELHYSIEQYDLRAAIAQLLQLIDHLVSSNEPFKNKDLQLKTLATVMAPILPTESINLFLSLKVEPFSWVSDWSSIHE